MLTRSVVCLGLVTLILMTSVTTSESRRHRGRQRKDGAKSGDVEKDGEVVKKGDDASVTDGHAVAAAVTGDGKETEDKTNAKKCEGCYLSPSVRIKVSRSRAPGSRRHRSRHRGRHRSRGHQGRRSGRKHHPRRTEGSGLQSSPGKDEASSPPSERRSNSEAGGTPSSSGASVERKKSSRSSRNQQKSQLSGRKRIAQGGRGKVDNSNSRQSQQSPEQSPEQAVSSQRHPEQPPEQAVADQGLPDSASESSPKSEGKSKKNSDKERKGRRKSQRGKSAKAKKTKKNDKDQSSNKDQSDNKDQSKASSFWSWLGFSSQEDSGDSTGSDASEENSDEEEQREDLKQSHHSEQNQETEESSSQLVPEKTPNRQREGAQDIQSNAKTSKSDRKSDLESEGKPERRRERQKNRQRTQDGQSVVRKHRRRKPGNRRNRKRGDDAEPKREREHDVKPNREREDDVKPKRERNDNVKPNGEREDDVKPKRERGDNVKPGREREGDVKPNREHGDDVKPNREREDDVKPRRERGDDAKPKRKRGGNAKPKRVRQGDGKSKQEQGDDVKPEKERGDDLGSEKEDEDETRPNRDPQHRRGLQTSHQNITRSHGQLPDVLKRHRQRQVSARRNRQRQGARRRQREHSKSGRRGRKHPVTTPPGSDSLDNEKEKLQHQSSASRDKGAQDAARRGRKHPRPGRQDKERHDDVTRDKERHDAVASDRKGQDNEGDESDMKNAEKRGKKHHGAGRRNREHPEIRKHEIKDQDNAENDKESQDASSGDRYLLISNLKRKRKDDVERVLQNVPRRENPDLKTSRRDRQRQRNVRLNQESQKNGRRDRERQEGVVRDRERQEGVTRDRERQEVARRDRERQRDVGRDRERQDSVARDRERQEGVARDRERQVSGTRDRERQRGVARDRERQGDASRDKERQGDARRDKERQGDARRDRERQKDVGRDRQRKRGVAHDKERQGDARRDQKSPEVARRDRERQGDARRDRERQRDMTRDRQRQSDMRRHRQQQEGFRRDRYHSYNARHYGRSRMAERRERERQRAARHEMERQIAARREREREMQVNRHRERQMAAQIERERLMAMRREREREIARRRERQRLEFSKRGRGRGRGKPMEVYDYRGRYVESGRSYNYPSRPAAADRLERRLSPSVHTHSRALLQSLQRTLSTLVGGLQAVKNVNEFVFNGTRYTIMMGVREQLKEIAEANDMVYDTILRATLLTKDIYMRAHQHRMTGPTTRSLDRPEMSLPSLYDVIRAAYDEERKAQQTLRNAQEFVRGRKSVSARLQQVREKFQDNFARNDLRTLVYYVNSTVQRLGQELSTSSQVAYLRRNTALLTNSRNNLTVARELIYKASDIMAKGMEDYRGNYKVVQDWRQFSRDQRRGVAPPLPLRRRRVRSVFLRHSRPIRDITAAERARLRPIIDRAKQHARQQERLARQVERLLRPAIQHGTSAITRKDDAALTAWLSSLVTRVQRDIKKMFSLLDSIRVLIRAEQELRWTFSVGGGACTEEGDDVEGSGCDGEGSGELIVEGLEEGSGTVPGTPTDDEDFVFVDESGPPKRVHRPPSLQEFGERLSVYVDGVHLRSRDVLERGDRLFEKTEKLSEKWSETKKIYDAADRSRRLWKQTKDVMENVTNYVDDISQFAVVFSQKVNRSYVSIQSRAQRALEIAERKLAEAQAHRAGGKEENDEEEGQADDDTVVIEAVEKAENVRKEMGTVRSLRRLTPESCGRASGQLVKLHANISHLRQQITTAKALLKTMQLAISKSGSGYLSIPVSEKALAPSSPHTRSQVSTPSLPTTVSMVTTVEVCVRTQDLDGPVLLVKGNKSASFSLAMSGRQISVEVYDASGYSLETVTSDVTMEEDMWYNVKVMRTGHRVLLQVMSRDGKEPLVDNDVSVSSMSLLQPSPVHVYVGGVAEDEPFSVGSDSWRGCLAELRVDGRAIPLFHSSSTGEAPQLCSSQCASTGDGQSLVFNGAGYLHFPSSVLPMRKRMQSIHFRFRTRQSSAAILHLVNQRQRFLLRVMLSNGALLIETTTPSESITLLSQASTYSDGVFHSLKILYKDSTTYPELDGQDGKFTIERSRPQNLNKMAEGVMIGGFVTGSLEFEKSKYRPLIGCLQELEIDEKPLSMTQAATSVGVFSGSCDSHSLWSQCVQFGADSTGIDLGAMDRSGTMLLLFSWDARGPLLSYSREGKYEAEVEATDAGLQVTTEKVDLTISRPDDAADHFILLTVTDDGKNAQFSAWGEEVKVTYGGFWANRADVDGEHQVQIGGAPDTDSDRRLFGQIAQAMVGQRFINLANYSDASSLEACQRALPELVMVDTPPEVTVSPEEGEETCSRDIRC